MGKHWLAGLLVAALLLCTGCAQRIGDDGQPLDAEALYREAVGKLEGQDLDYSYRLTFSMQVDGETVETCQETQVKTQLVDGELRMWMSVVVMSSGEEVEMVMQLQDGMFYIEAYGMKMAVSEEFFQMAAGFDFQEQMTALFEEDSDMAWENMWAERTQDGYRLSEELSPDRMNALLAAAGMEESSLEITGNQTYWLRNDKWISSVQADLQGKMAEDGQEIAFQLEAAMTFNNPGQPVVIEDVRPEDYIKMDDELLERFFQQS